MAETLDCVVEKITFQNAESGFCVLRVRTAKTVCTVVGHLPAAREGDAIRAVGAWREDRRYGLQFSAESIVPRRAEGRAPTSPMPREATSSSSDRPTNSSPKKS